MHPPFPLDGRPAVWIRHVRQAWDVLAPGGRLVGIVPQEFAVRRDEEHDALRELVTLHGGYRELPAEAFISAGVSVRAVVILAHRPGIPAWAGITG
jgi:hypothetical protein